MNTFEVQVSWFSDSHMRTWGVSYKGEKLVLEDVVREVMLRTDKMTWTLVPGHEVVITTDNKNTQLGFAGTCVLRIVKAPPSPPPILLVAP